MRLALFIASAFVLALGGLVAPASAHAAASEASAEVPPFYAAEMERAERFVAGMMEQGIVVPVPKDPGGGYTHEQHRRNYRAMYLAGQLYRISGEQSYRDYVRDMLLAYAELYAHVDVPHASDFANYADLNLRQLALCLPAPPLTFPARAECAIRFDERHGNGLPRHSGLLASRPRSAWGGIS